MWWIQQSLFSDVIVEQLIISLETRLNSIFRKWWRTIHCHSCLIQPKKPASVYFPDMQKMSFSSNGLSFQTASYFTTVRTFAFMSHIHARNNFLQICMVIGLIFPIAHPCLWCWIELSNTIIMKLLLSDEQSLLCVLTLFLWHFISQCMGGRRRSSFDHLPPWESSLGLGRWDCQRTPWKFRKWAVRGFLTYLLSYKTLSSA